MKIIIARTYKKFFVEIFPKYVGFLPFLVRLFQVVVWGYFEITDCANRKTVTVCENRDGDIFCSHFENQQDGYNKTCLEIACFSV